MTDKTELEAMQAEAKEFRREVEGAEGERRKLTIVRTATARATANYIDSLEQLQASRAQRMDEKKCVCGDPSTAGSVHRTDGPCHVDESAPVVLQGAAVPADLMKLRKIYHRPLGSSKDEFWVPLADVQAAISKAPASAVAAPDAQKQREAQEDWPNAAELLAEKLDNIAEQWAECMYDAPFALIDIGAALRTEFAKLNLSAIEQEVQRRCRAQRTNNDSGKVSRDEVLDEVADMLEASNDSSGDAAAYDQREMTMYEQEREQAIAFCVGKVRALKSPPVSPGVQNEEPK